MSTETNTSEFPITEISKYRFRFNIVPIFIPTPDNTLIRSLFVDRFGNLVSSPTNISGKSAYQIAVANGFVGTEVDWLASLKGEDGITYTHRHDFLTGTSYNGKALLGSLDTASVWLIVRIVVSINGSTVVTQATNVKWVDRFTETYI